MNNRPMSRREAVAQAGGWLAMMGLGIAAVRSRSADDYVPVGHLSVEDPVARNVAWVELDGERITEAFELDDAEGWVRYYVRGDDGKLVVEDRQRGVLRIARRTGSVRVHWKEGRANG